MQQRKILFWPILFYILLFVVLPPVVLQFFSSVPTEIVAHYPFSVFFGAGIAFLIYYFSLKGKIFKEPVLREKLPFFVYSSNALIAFGLLCLSSVLFEIIAFMTGIESGIHKVIFPDSVLGKINFIFGVIAAAFSEEVIYRFYLPMAFFEIFKRRLSSQFLCETLAVLLFALGHIYLGTLGFFNAFFCGIILRNCMIRTKTLWIPFAIHAAYNFLSFAFFATC